jgi:hypothetical protein
MDILQLSKAVLNYEALTVSSLVQDLYRSKQPLAEIAKPRTEDATLLSISAALLELLASQWHQQPPNWTQEVRGVSQPLFLIKHAQTMKYLRQLCETQSPEPLKKRNLFATPNFLEFV